MDTKGKGVEIQSQCMESYNTSFFLEAGFLQRLHACVEAATGTSITFAAEKAIQGSEPENTNSVLQGKQTARFYCVTFRYNNLQALLMRLL